MATAKSSGCGCTTESALSCMQRRSLLSGLRRNARLSCEARVVQLRPGIQPSGPHPLQVGSDIPYLCSRPHDPATVYFAWHALVLTGQPSAPKLQATHRRSGLRSEFCRRVPAVARAGVGRARLGIPLRFATGSQRMTGASSSMEHTLGGLECHIVASLVAASEQAGRVADRPAVPGRGTREPAGQSLDRPMLDDRGRYEAWSRWTLLT